MSRFYTKEQQEWRDKILGSRKYKSQKKSKPLIPHPDNKTFIQGKAMYLNNCIFWLHEFDCKRTTQERALGALFAIEQHCKELRDHILLRQTK